MTVEGMIQGYRRISGPTETPDGFPLPLTGRPLTQTPVVVKKEGVALKQYPETYLSGEEELGEDEIRLTCLGSGNPFVRRAQAATGWLCELGNGDKFVFDVGGGTVQNLWSLEIHPALLDKLFLTHLHLDHVGDFHVLYDALGWARNSPLHVWGPSGYTPEMGTATFCDMMEKAAFWHDQSKMGIIPNEGMEIVAHEFDYGKLGPANPNMLVYDENDVQIYAFPTVHCIYGTVGYRLEWNGLSFSFHGDGTPSAVETEQAKGVDVFMHEVFVDAETFSRKANIPLHIAKLVVGEHTTGDRFGQLMEKVQPSLGVGYHYSLDDDTVDAMYELLWKTSDIPMVLAQDFTVINITPEQIVTRQADTNLLHWTPPLPPGAPHGKLGARSEAKIPQWLVDSVIPPLE
jgi:ribonuclease Z